VLGICQRQS